MMQEGRAVDGNTVTGGRESGNGREQRAKVMKMVKDYKVGILLLQECHKRKDHTPLFNDRIWGQVYESRGSNRARGVAILIKNTIDFQVEMVKRDSDGRWVMIKGKIEKIRITLVCIYAPNKNQKKYFKKLFGEIDKFAQGEVYCAGDYNLELVTTRQNSNRKLNIREYNMNDLLEGEPENNRWTYYSGRHDTYSKIDYILGKNTNQSVILEAKTLPIHLSDHAPLRVKVKLEIERKERTWRYNTVLNSREEEYETIRKEINKYFETNDNGQVTKDIIWDASKAVIRGHCISLEVNLRRRWRNEQDKRIKEIETLQDKHKRTKDRQIWRELKEKKNQLEAFEERNIINKYLYVKSYSQSWNIKSMKRMAYYLKKKKEKTWIKRLKDENGKEQEEQSKIREIMAKYYKNLYKEERVMQGNLNIREKIAEEDRELLNQPITQEETIRAIKGLKGGKSPGPDGFPAEYYKAFMEELAPHLTELFNEIYTKQKVPLTWKVSEIITIPKKGRDLTQPGSYRPISLCNQDYKIFTKILAKRLETIMPKIIKEDQYGFVKGRKIGDPIKNVVIAMNHANSNKKKMGILKLDVYKAFDKVNHNYLLRLCQQLNMGENFCKTLQQLYSNCKAKIRVNNGRTGEIPILNGTKQGCPLSPTLFVIAIEMLAESIRNSTNWTGYKIEKGGGQKEEIRLNFFADDAMIITSQPLIMVKDIIKKLEEFKNISGLFVNIKKSEILCLNTPPREQLEIRKISGLRLGLKKLKYLGVWIYKNPKSIVKGNYKQKWKVIEKQFKNWEGKTLTRVDRIRALKMFIIPKLTYLFQTLPNTVDRKTLKTWDRRIRKWAVGGKRPRIRDKWLNAKEEEGGWGIPSLEVYHDAFQIQRLLEIQYTKKKWANMEKIINNTKEKEIIFREWSRREEAEFKEPFKGTIKVWKKRKKKLSPGNE
uniref:Reverse transcriptase domain-containing protein n=1 Tax=Anolis carolinensis TaxID=28377 RepID=R4GBN4_ANOCA